MDVYGVGTLAIDVLCKLDQLPSPDGFSMVSSVSRQPGGSCANVLCQLARLGASCAFAGAVGDDDHGREFRSSLVSEGIDVTGLVSLPGRRTLTTSVFVDASGEHAILLDVGDAFEGLRPGDLDPALISSCRVLFTDLLPREACLHALRIARDAGVITVANLQVGMATMRAFGWSEESLREILPLIDVLAPSQALTHDLCHDDDPDACAALLRSWGASEMVLTLGSRGSVAYDAHGVRTQAEARASHVVDTTGAGDSYLGGYVFARVLKHSEVDEAMALATECASVTVEGFGARSGPGLDHPRVAGIIRYITTCAPYQHHGISNATMR